MARCVTPSATSMARLALALANPSTCNSWARLSSDLTRLFSGSFLPGGAFLFGSFADPSVLSLQFSDWDDLCVGPEFLIVAEGDVIFYVEILQQGEADVDLYGHVLGQPDFIVDAGLLEHDARALVYAGQKQAERNCVDALDVELLPL